MIPNTLAVGGIAKWNQITCSHVKHVWKSDYEIMNPHKKNYDKEKIISRINKYIWKRPPADHKIYTASSLSNLKFFHLLTSIWCTSCRHQVGRWLVVLLCDLGVRGRGWAGCLLGLCCVEGRSSGHVHLVRVYWVVVGVARRRRFRCLRCCTDTPLEGTQRVHTTVKHDMLLVSSFYVLLYVFEPA